MPVLTPEERVGSLIAGKYRLDAILGRGGMGVVFSATHTWTDRPVAVKLLHPETARDPAVAQRFLGEARAAATLRHPHVVDVLDMGQDSDGAVYLVLEMLEGRSLAARLEEGALEVAEAMATLLPVMDALEGAHAKGTIHRDLKPENIFLSRDGAGRCVPKVLDFGIAKHNDASALGVKTATGQLLGTPYYMSPEQARGAADLGAQSDVWSMGVVWFESLSRQLPHNDESLGALIIKLVTVPPPSVGSVTKDLPAPVIAAIDGALKIERAERHASMAAFVKALRLAAQQCGIEVPTSSAFEPSTRKASVPSRPPMELAATAAAALDADVPKAPGAWGVESVSAVSRDLRDSASRTPKEGRNSRLGAWGIVAGVTVCLAVGAVGVTRLRESHSTASGPPRSAASTRVQSEPSVPVAVAVPAAVIVPVATQTAMVVPLVPITPDAAAEPAPLAPSSQQHTMGDRGTQRVHGTAPRGRTAHAHDESPRANEPAVAEPPAARPPANAPAPSTGENRAPDLRDQF